MFNWNQLIKMHCPDFIRIQMKKYEWGLVDFIYIRTSPNHVCIRKISMITENGEQMDVEFSPCKDNERFRKEISKTILYKKSNYV